MKITVFMKHFLTLPLLLASFAMGVAAPRLEIPSQESDRKSQPYSEEWESLAKTAQTGDPAAQYELGCMYKEGKFVVANPKEAFYWFRKAASNGNADAMLQVGYCFRDGYGVIADNRIAAENFWRAAEAGNPEGAYRYAEMLRDGVGVAQDKGKAWFWFDKAAKSGFADSATQAYTLKSFAAHKPGKSLSSQPAKAKHKQNSHKQSKHKRKHRR